jgi:hypothetical protein
MMDTNQAASSEADEPETVSQIPAAGNRDGGCRPYTVGAARPHLSAEVEFPETCEGLRRGDRSVNWRLLCGVIFGESLPVPRADAPKKTFGQRRPPGPLASCRRSWRETIAFRERPHSLRTIRQSLHDVSTLERQMSLDRGDPSLRRRANDRGADEAPPPLARRHSWKDSRANAARGLPHRSAFDASAQSTRA